MRRACLLLAVACLALPSHAAADTMDPALSRLRVSLGRPGCEQTGVADQALFCPNEELFERLASELGVSLAPLVATPVRTGGPRGFSLQLDSTITSIDPGAHWKLGSEGKPGRSLNASPSPVLVWNRAELRKGLPLGFEVGASLGQGMSTSLWAVGLLLKWAIIEGFRTGAGALPDVALQAGTTRMMGSDDLRISAHTFDLIFSKPFVAGGGWTISPLLSAQLLLLRAQTGIVDLTPGNEEAMGMTPAVLGDAFESCDPTPDTTTNGAPLDCSTGMGGQDFASSARFDSVSQTRVRMSLGGQVRRGIWLASAAFGFDLLAPTVQAERPVPSNSSPNHVRQLAVRVIVGAAL